MWHRSHINLLAWTESSYSLPKIISSSIGVVCAVHGGKPAPFDTLVVFLAGDSTPMIWGGGQRSKDVGCVLNGDFGPFFSQDHLVCSEALKFCCNKCPRNSCKIIFLIAQVYFLQCKWNGSHMWVYQITCRLLNYYSTSNHSEIAFRLEGWVWCQETSFPGAVFAMQLCFVRWIYVAGTNVRPDDIVNTSQVMQMDLVLC